MILTVTLNPGIDKMLIVDNFKLNNDYRVKEVILSAGGKGINVSRVIKLLGGKTLVYTIVGGYAAKFFETELKREKINAKFTYIKKGVTRTNTTIIDVSKKKITRLLEKGPVLLQNDIIKIKQTLTALIQKTKIEYAVLSGTLPQGVDEYFYSDIIDIMNKKNIKVVLDTSGLPLQLAIKNKPYIIKPNLSEAEELLNIKLKNLSELKDAVNFLLKCGIKIVCITCGNKGVIVGVQKELLDKYKSVTTNKKENIFFAQPPEIEIKNNVGSGDAFLGGFIFSLSKKENIESAIKTGVSAGISNTLSYKPGYIDKKNISFFYSKIKVKELCIE